MGTSQLTFPIFDTRGHKIHTTVSDKEQQRRARNEVQKSAYEAYASNPSDENRDRVIQAHEGVIKTLAQKFQGDVSYEDLEQLGWIAAAQCLERFQQQASFAGYLYKTLACEFLGVVEEARSEVPFSTVFPDDEEGNLNPRLLGLESNQPSPPEEVAFPDVQEEMGTLIREHMPGRTGDIATEALVYGSVQSAREKFKKSQATVYRCVEAVRHTMRAQPCPMGPPRRKRIPQAFKQSLGVITSLPQV